LALGSGALVWAVGRRVSGTNETSDEVRVNGALDTFHGSSAVRESERVGKGRGKRMKEFVCVCVFVYYERMRLCFVCFCAHLCLCVCV
jgi:hypothetical protein